MMARGLRNESRLIRTSLASAGCLVIAGCHSAPLFNILGSFFPAWMVCLVAGVLLTLVVRWLLQRKRVENHLRPLVIVYPALVTLFTCTIWLLLFS